MLLRLARRLLVPLAISFLTWLQIICLNWIRSHLLKREFKNENLKMYNRSHRVLPMIRMLEGIGNKTINTSEILENSIKYFIISLALFLEKGL